MQTRKQWGSKTKVKIVIEGLQGRNVADICTEYGISQSQYYKWRDIFLAHIEQPFETGAKSKKEQKLEQENIRLRKVTGDLTVESKKRLVKLHRKSSAAAEYRNRSLLESIKELKSLHPFWGYRRIWATLRRNNEMTVNHKRIYRLMKQNNLSVERRQLKALDNVYTSSC